MSKALDDVVVVELTTEFWSATGAALLADFGARVIKLDPLGAAPEPARRGREAGTQPPGWNAEAELAQRNKMSLALDLSTKAGRAIIAELIGKADVFLTDWPAGDIENQKLSYAALRAIKPDLIYARGSGFGPKGPARDLPALDELAEARTGMMPIRPQPGEPPVYSHCGQMYTSVMLALGITLALCHRRETGEGQEVDASLFAGSMYGASLDVQAYLAMGGERFLHPVSRLDAGNPMSGVLYQASDGRWVCLTMPDTDRWWPGFAPLVELDVDDPRFDSHDKRCVENRLEMIRVLDEAFGKKSSEHWKQVLTESQLSADVIEEFQYPAGDEQARRNRYILGVDRPGVGRVKTLGFPLFMSDTPARLSRPAPCAGQHSAEVLHDMLGYSEERIGELVRDRIVANS